MFDEAKRWFEAATVICRFVPGGKERAEKVRRIRLRVLSMSFHWYILGTPNWWNTGPFKISETYTHLLSRYGPERWASGGWDFPLDWVLTWFSAMGTILGCSLATVSSVFLSLSCFDAMHLVYFFLAIIWLVIDPWTFSYSQLLPW